MGNIPNSYTKYAIVGFKGKYENGEPYLACHSFDGSITTMVNSDVGLSKNAYEKAEVGDIYNTKTNQFVPMTEEILAALMSEKNGTFPYMFLKKEHRSDPKILERALHIYNPYNYARIPGMGCPVAHALPEALTDENIELAISAGWPIKFSNDEDGTARKKKFADYMNKYYNMSDKEFESLVYLGIFNPLELKELSKKK